MSLDELGFNREFWTEHSTAFFEYHCYEGHDSSDAELWYRSQQEVTVLGLDPDAENEILSGFIERAESGLPLVYRIRFSDGMEFSAWEDELLTSTEGFYRSPPPKKRYDYLERGKHED